MSCGSLGHFSDSERVVAAMALHRFTKVPLIADLRDPMVYEGWPEDRWMRATYGRIEKRVVALASAIVVTTPGARRLYVERYPDVPPSRFRVIANGVDDAMKAGFTNSEFVWKRPIVLVHSGLMEVPDRDPTAFFEAIAQCASKAISSIRHCGSCCGQPAATKSIAVRLPRSESVALFSSNQGFRT